MNDPLEWAEVSAIDDVAAPTWDAETRAEVVDACGHGERLDRWLGRLAGEFSRNHLQNLIRDGYVSVNGAVISTPSRKVQIGQNVSVTLMPTAQSQAFKPELIDLDVCFEDEHVVVVNKPAGMVVHPAAGNWSGTLLNGLLARYPASVQLPRAGIVHRLDKDTSGLMVVAKTLAAQTALTRMIADRVVRREYCALVHGRVAATLTTVDAPMGRDPVSRVRMAVVAGGRPSRTDVRLIEAGAISAILCRLHTGRTHQIRVHMASRGHPLVADEVYGGRVALGLNRQALHALRLAFDHPIHGQPLAFDMDPPEDLRAAWQGVTGQKSVIGYNRAA
jgi:23S rRNA pseudouridine1911/1915/1917 synthase